MLLFQRYLFELLVTLISTKFISKKQFNIFQSLIIKLQKVKIFLSYNSAYIHCYYLLVIADSQLFKQFDLE